jgi:hypothetical protein
MAPSCAHRPIIRRITCGWPRIKPFPLLSSLRSRRASHRWYSSPLHLEMHGRRFTPALPKVKDKRPDSDKLKMKPKNRGCIL